MANEGGGELAEYGFLEASEENALMREGLIMSHVADGV